MLEFQDKRKIKRFIYSKITLVLLVVVVAFLLNAVWNVYKKQDYTRENLVKITASLASLRVREKMLSSEVERLKTENGVEEEIRAKYGLVKPGEEVIIVVNDDSSTSADSMPIENNLWQKFLNLFK